MINVLVSLLKSYRPYFLFVDCIIIKEKGKSDYVTNVDHGLEKDIKRRLAILYPHLGFLGEEENRRVLTDDFFILDPIDGTTNFIRHHHMSCISLALCQKGVITLGVIYDPYFDEVFTAEKGKGFALNGKTISHSEENPISCSLIAIGTSPYNKAIGQRMFGVFQRIAKDTADIRRSGSAALDLAYVACGRLDGFIEANLKLWDYAAGALMVAEAGGSISSFSKKEINLHSNSDIVAGKQNVYNYLQEIIKEELR